MSNGTITTADELAGHTTFLTTAGKVAKREQWSVWVWNQKTKEFRPAIKEPCDIEVAIVLGHV